MKHPNGQRRRGALAGSAVIVALALVAASCGKSSSSTTTAAPATTQAPATTEAPATTAAPATTEAPATTAAADPVQAGIDHAKAEIAKYAAEPKAEINQPPVSGDLSSLKGGEIWYVPIAYAFAPFFAVVEKGLRDAAALLGMTVKLCDAAGDPTVGANCIADGTRAKAAAIITDAIPYELAPDALDAATAAGIPVVYMDAGYPSETGNKDPWKKNTAYVTFDTRKALRLAADWIIVDSAGKANVIAIRITDSGWTSAGMSEGAVPEFKDFCPNCKVTVVDSNSAQTADRPSVVAAAIAANPGVTHLLPEFDSTVEPSGALEGAQNAGVADKVKFATTTGQLSGLQRIKSGQFLFANAGANNYQESWAAIDQVIRLHLGMEPVMDPVIQMRLFTADNVGNLTLTQDEYVKGTFFGASGFQDIYKKLWGIV